MAVVKMIHSSLPQSLRNQRLDDPITKHSACLVNIASFTANITIYNDGSAMAGLKDGGNVGIVTTRDPEDLSIIKT